MLRNSHPSSWAGLPLITGSEASLYGSVPASWAAWPERIDAGTAGTTHAVCSRHYASLRCQQRKAAWVTRGGWELEACTALLSSFHPTPDIEICLWAVNIVENTSRAQHYRSCWQTQPKIFHTLWNFYPLVQNMALLSSQSVGPVGIAQTRCRKLNP